MIGVSQRTGMIMVVSLRLLYLICELRIVIPPGGSVERVVDLVGLIDVLPIAPDLAAALR